MCLYIPVNINKQNNILINVNEYEIIQDDYSYLLNEEKKYTYIHLIQVSIPLFIFEFILFYCIYKNKY